MKIAAIYTQSVGPLPDGEIRFENDWSGEIESNVLITGPNGCGKSTLLRAISLLWRAFGHWLGTGTRLNIKDESYTWFYRWDASCAMILDSFSPKSEDQIGLFLGSEAFLVQLKEKYPQVYWLGETVSRTKGTTPETTVFTSSEHFFLPYKNWWSHWSSQYQRLVLKGPSVDMPNLVYLDAEARRWVRPQKDIGSLSPDDSSQAWLATYEVNDNWKGQLESSLFNMKATMPDEYPEMIATLNQFFSGKHIEAEIHPGQRQRVLLDSGNNHSLDALSSGEHQVLIMLFTVQRWLQPGGVVLIDEPDLHLHPSLISPLLASIENIVARKNGQLVMTSHTTDIWQRYDNMGLRIDLTDGKDAENGQR
ncbi:AAA family ATPase [Salmonella enterica]|uniref:AAA family ATPase n=2 Tax=Salmonella enterica TaxID=28901 RepID=A0A5U2IQE3_SALER|nr:ATP-binding protein [Salmonella enterica]EAA5451233.1 ATP-binding protein [Salmonella enterica subsp. enterica]EAR5281426.1 ATP-binding protein [Salmonella enterica subsp. enterica serovar Livingstone]EBS2298200.1 ATP-binding protein [Salmonella enterica subsp. enterica serovar Saintpaul]EDG3269893.1 AAA family ATPase [Salmonella enterica subsp. enterica serovar Enteritidis]EDM6931426.1 ATP-binding protein [Salmonella enterica subsp. enterica serovar Typhimurium]EDW0015978.1 AAA family ATP